MTRERGYKTLLTAVLAVAFIAVFAPMAAANFASPFIILATPHLYVFNIIIGVIEASIIAAFFKGRVLRTYILMVAANMVSMLAGIITVGIMWEIRGESVFRDGLVLFELTLATLIIESPFIHNCFPLEKKSINRTVVAVIVVNVASLILLLLYAKVVSVVAGPSNFPRH